jgi:hypothetical protein
MIIIFTAPVVGQIRTVQLASRSFFSNYVLYPNTVNFRCTPVFPLGLVSAPLQEIFDL